MQAKGRRAPKAPVGGNQGLAMPTESGEISMALALYIDQVVTPV